MAFGHGIDADFYLDVSGTPTDMTSYLSEIDPEFQRALDELSMLGATYTQQLAGIRSFTLSANGKFDPTLDAAVYAAWNGDTAVTWEYYPQGKVSGKIYYYGEGRIPNYKPGPASSTAGVGFSYTIVNDGAVTRATYSP